MSEALFREAFEQIGLAAGQAAALPDHRERPRESPEVTVRSAGGEVTVTVQDGKLSGFNLDQFWLEGEEADSIAQLIKTTVNEAYEEWSRQELASVMAITPDVKELYGALGAARAKLDEAWVRGLAEAKS